MLTKVSMLAFSKLITPRHLCLSKPTAIRCTCHRRQGGLPKGGWHFLLGIDSDTLQGSHPQAKVSTEMKTHLSHRTSLSSFHVHMSQECEKRGHSDSIQAQCRCCPEGICRCGRRRPTVGSRGTGHCPTGVVGLAQSGESLKYMWLHRGR